MGPGLDLSMRGGLALFCGPIEGRSRWCRVPARINCLFWFLKIHGRYASDETPLGRLWSPPPWHDAVARAGEKACAIDQCRPAGCVEAAKNVGPRSIATHGGAQAARAIRQAPNGLDYNPAAFGRFRRRRR